MAKRITPKLIQASDDLGIVLAEIAALQEQKGDLQKVLIDSGFDEIDGELFRATVSHSVRKQVAWKRIAEELEDRFGPIPDPVDNLIKLQQARVKLAGAGARVAEFRGGRLIVAPLSLDSEQVKALRKAIPDAVYESLKKTVRIRVPDEPSERFPAAIRAADELLRVSAPRLAPSP
ncbi:hypothetical protein LCGC14_3057260 [marine sediment metagenome]|uniref:Transcription-repair-coupling factor C-terminal domain-containing protein n=1 Tax=marine sediment metagenome TaxID=412755 RepID=A0A0F8WJV6_9ZZZZ